MQSLNLYINIHLISLSHCIPHVAGRRREPSVKSRTLYSQRSFFLFTKLLSETLRIYAFIFFYGSKVIALCHVSRNYVLSWETQVLLLFPRMGVGTYNRHIHYPTLLYGLLGSHLYPHTYSRKNRSYKIVSHLHISGRNFAKRLPIKTPIKL